MTVHPLNSPSLWSNTLLAVGIERLFLVKIVHWKVPFSAEDLWFYAVLSACIAVMCAVQLLDLVWLCVILLLSSFTVLYRILSAEMHPSSLIFLVEFLLFSLAFDFPFFESLLVFLAFISCLLCEENDIADDQIKLGWKTATATCFLSASAAKNAPKGQTCSWKKHPQPFSQRCAMFWEECWTENFSISH